MVVGQVTPPAPPPPTINPTPHQPSSLGGTFNGDIIPLRGDISRYYGAKTDLTRGTWSTSTDAPWVGVKDSEVFGYNFARSGVVTTKNGTSYLQVAVTARENGGKYLRIEFDYATSGLLSDSLRFSCSTNNGVSFQMVHTEYLSSGGVWVRKFYSLPVSKTGDLILRWTFTSTVTKPNASNWAALNRVLLEAATPQGEMPHLTYYRTGMDYTADSYLQFTEDKYFMNGMMISFHASIGTNSFILQEALSPTGPWANTAQGTWFYSEVTRLNKVFYTFPAQLGGKSKFFRLVSKKK